MRSAEIGRVGRGDAGFIHGGGGGFAIGTAAGLDQNDAKGGFDVVGIHIDGELVTGMQERIADGLAVFAAKLGLCEQAKTEHLVGWNLEEHVLLGQFAKRAVDRLDGDFRRFLALLLLLPLGEVNARKRYRNSRRGPGMYRPDIDSAGIVLAGTGRADIGQGGY